MNNDGKNILNLYFGALVFQKIDPYPNPQNLQNSQYVTYAAKIKTFLVSLAERYVLAFVPTSESYLQKGKLKELGWVNLQVRSLPTKAYNVNSQDWTAPVSSKSIPALFFKLKDRNERWSTYRLDAENSEALFNFEVRLMHKPTKKTIYQYPNNMNFHQIVDQFETIFDMIQQQQYPQQTINLLTEYSNYHYDYHNPAQDLNVNVNTSGRGVNSDFELV